MPASRSAQRSGTSPPRQWTPSAGSRPTAARLDGGTSTPPPGPPSLASGRRLPTGSQRQAIASSTHGVR
eukprot:14019666-Alexandrium_andersonii.AAC.1